MQAQEYETLADSLLELLHLRGIEVFLANPGTDLACLVEAYRKRCLKGKGLPRGILVPHEEPLAAIAYGYYLAKGKPCVLFLHGSIGAMNTVGIIMTAKRNHIPIIIVSGAMPHKEKARFLPIQWAQDMGDGLSPIREFVKWSCEVREPCELVPIFDRAYALSQADPKGPVYLILPPETLHSPSPSVEIPAEPSFDIPLISPDPLKVRELAYLLEQASFPVLITSSLGRDAEAMETLVKLSSELALGVVSFVPEYMNFPISHPFHLGFSPERVLSLSDLILVCECDVPWIPGKEEPRASAKVAHLGVDPLYSDVKLRGFRSDLTVSGSSSKIFSELLNLLRELQIDRQCVEERAKVLQRMHEEVFGGLKRAATAGSSKSSLQPSYVSHMLCSLLPKECYLVNEYDNRIPAYLDLPAGRYFCSPHTGYLGWAFGVSLGVKLAQPKAEVIATMGDGSYLFSVPTSCHYVSFAYDLPVLCVVYNNKGFAAVRRATTLLYPKGFASSTGAFPLCDFEKDIPYEKICEAFSGYGERVEDPRALRSSLERAIQVLKGGRQVLLNVMCEP